MSDFVIFGTFIRSGVCSPHSLIGLTETTHSTSAYSVHTPSCIVDTVIVSPPVLPPTAESAIVLYWL